jgi:hypothetical protein
MEVTKEKTSADYYWNSYAHFGIHEEMLKEQFSPPNQKPIKSWPLQLLLPWK